MEHLVAGNLIMRRALGQAARMLLPIQKDEGTLQLLAKEMLPQVQSTKWTRLIVVFEMLSLFPVRFCSTSAPALLVLL